VTGDINNPIVDGSTLDGVTLDFNINQNLWVRSLSLIAIFASKEPYNYYYTS
jgi:hypothetical protein